MDLNARMEALAPVLRSLPAGTQVAFIQEGDELCLYNISAAFDLVTGRSPTAVGDVSELAHRIRPKNEGPDDEEVSLIDPGHAATVDISYPVLLVRRRDSESGPGRVIDGWHRIYKAAQLGIKELPAIVLTEEDVERIAIEPGVEIAPPKS